jgi:hypothetical protein
MNFIIKRVKLAVLTVSFTTATVFFACTPDAKDVALPAKPAVSFTATPVAGNPNLVAIKSTSPNTFLWSWDLGNGTTSKKETDTVLFDTKGQYVIKLNAFGAGGYSTATQTITIANDYPGVEILKGGNMDAASQANWTILNTGGTQTSITFTNGALKFSNTGNTNGAIYQALSVKAGKKYTFSADVAGGGATNTWFEVYVGKTVPTQGSDYSDNKFIALNTWSGCGGSAFSGNLALIGCDGSGAGKGGVMTFTQTGTVYLVIKGGSSGGNMGTGITIDNISVKEK